MLVIAFKTLLRQKLRSHRKKSITSQRRLFLKCALLIIDLYGYLSFKYFDEMLLKNQKKEISKFCWKVYLVLRTFNTLIRCNTFCIWYIGGLIILDFQKYTSNITYHSWLVKEILKTLKLITTHFKELLV